CGRPDHAERLACGKHEIDLLADYFLLAGWSDGAVLNHERARRRLERHRFATRRQMPEQFRQALPALARTDEAAPIGDGKIDRRERAAPQDRAGDDDARRRLLIDHE